MNSYRWLRTAALLVALAMASVVPALAEETESAGEEAAETTAAATTTSNFNAPVAVPMGQGWYGAASTVSQDGWMAQAAPWSNNLIGIRGTARVAAIDGNSQPRTMTVATNRGRVRRGYAAGATGPVGATGPLGTTPSANKLIAGVAQWMVPADGSLWEVRFTGIDPAALFGGAGVLRVVDGRSGRGMGRFPRTLAYVMVTGPVDVYRNGQQIATGLQGHIMATQGIRSATNGHLLRRANEHPEDIQLHLLVTGAIPGRTQNSLYVFWPNATLDLRNLSNPVALLPSEVQTAMSYMTPQAAVAGYQGTESAVVPLLLVSLRDRFLARSIGELPAGDVDLTVVNDSTVPQGFYIQGPGIDQHTQRLAPGDQTTMRVHLMPGTYRIAAFAVANPTTADYYHWDVVNVHP